MVCDFDRGGAGGFERSIDRKQPTPAGAAGGRAGSGGEAAGVGVAAGGEGVHERGVAAIEGATQELGEPPWILRPRQREAPRLRVCPQRESRQAPVLG